MCVVRDRFNYQWIKRTIFIDWFVVIIFFIFIQSPTVVFGFIFILFQSMFLGFYPVALTIFYFVYMAEWQLLLFSVTIVMTGLTLNFWENELKKRFKQRDYFSKKNYDLESLQNELTNALAQVEQMSIIAERSRISSEIHDNAGHEIIASYISLQTVGKIMEKNPEKAMELFDKSMNRLNAGVGKMRDAVHNMSAVTFMGIDRMTGICENYSKVPVQFKTSGDMTGVTTNVWHVMEAILNESLTNVMKHSKATNVRVELDVTKHLVRLLIENDGVMKKNEPAGTGLRNLRYRAVTVGGSLTVSKDDETFKVVCIVPIG
jgi:signal transduction histidine kinase